MANIGDLAARAAQRPAVLDDPQIRPELRDAAKKYLPYLNADQPERPPEEVIDNMLTDMERAIRSRSDL